MRPADPAVGCAFGTASFDVGLGRRSCRWRWMAMLCRAQSRRRSPRRLRRCRVVMPGDAGMGTTPAGMASAASLGTRPWCDQATRVVAPTIGPSPMSSSRPVRHSLTRSSTRHWWVPASVRRSWIGERAHIASRGRGVPGRRWGTSGCRCRRSGRWSCRGALCRAARGRWPRARRLGVRYRRSSRPLSVVRPAGPRERLGRRWRGRGQGVASGCFACESSRVQDVGLLAHALCGPVRAALGRTCRWPGVRWPGRDAGYRGPRSPSSGSYRGGDELEKLGENLPRGAGGEIALFCASQYPTARTTPVAVLVPFLCALLRVSVPDPQSRPQAPGQSCFYALFCASPCTTSQDRNEKREFRVSMRSSARFSARLGMLSVSDSATSFLCALLRVSVPDEGV